MAEQWEMCSVLITVDHVLLYTPEGYTDCGYQEFLLRNDPSFKSSGNIFPHQVICQLLAGGWQPYAVGEGVRYFRRKYPG